MPRIKINTDEVINSSGNAKSAAGIAYDMAGKIGSVRGRTDSQILARHGISGDLRSAQKYVAKISEEITAIYRAAEMGVRQYESAERTVLNERKLVGNIVVTQKQTERYNAYTKLFSTERTEKFTEIKLTDEQTNQLIGAIEKNDKAEALKVLGIVVKGQYGEVEEKAINSLWKDLCIGFKENVVKDAKTKFRDDVLETSGSWAAKIVASHINMNTLLHVGPVGPNSFVVLDAQVASKTASMMSSVTTGLKIGLPVIGGIVDYAFMRNEGETVEDAGVKAVAHVGIGIAGGKVGAAIGATIGSIIPGAGTAVGAVAGFAVGVLITSAGNAMFDAVYDNRERIKDTAVDAWNMASDWINEKGQQLANAAGKAVERLNDIGSQAQEWLGDVGDAWKAGWNALGSVFG